jgi:hypothetical protein
MEGVFLILQSYMEINVMFTLKPQLRVAALILISSQLIHCENNTNSVQNKDSLSATTDRYDYYSALKGIFLLHDPKTLSPSEIIRFSFIAEQDIRLNFSHSPSSLGNPKVYLESELISSGKSVFSGEKITVEYTNRLGLNAFIGITPVEYDFSVSTIIYPNSISVHYPELSAGTYYISSSAPFGGDTVLEINGVSYNNIGSEQTLGENITLSLDKNFSVIIKPEDSIKSSFQYALNIKRVSPE